MNIPRPTPGPAPVTVSMYEKTPRIYPRSVSGPFASARWAMVWLTQLVFYGLPWLRWDGHQAVLFDLESRHFRLLALALVPQDFIFLAAQKESAALALHFVTRRAGSL